MPTSTITLNGNTVTLVPLPATPAPRMVEPWVNDSIAISTSPFSGQTETQDNPGADAMGLMVTYAPLRTQVEAPAVLAWLMQMRGQLRAVLMGPPEYKGPFGTPSGTPVVDSTTVTNNVAGMKQIVTRGWTPSAANLLKPYDCIQIGYRLYRVLDTVSADATGAATFEIFPSIRESIEDGTTIITANPVGLFRLATNKRNWSSDYTGFSHISFPLTEFGR